MPEVSCEASPFYPGCNAERAETSAGVAGMALGAVKDLTEFRSHVPTAVNLWFERSSGDAATGTCGTAKQYR